MDQTRSSTNAIKGKAQQVHFALWIASCFVFAIWAIRHHGFALKILVLGVICLPYIASDLVTGRPINLPSLHPSSWLAIAVFLVATIARPREVFRLVIRDPIPNFLIAVVLTIITATAVLRDGSSGLALLVNQIAVPYLLFVWTQFEIRRDTSYARSLAIYLVTLGVLQSFLSLLQWSLGQTFFYSSQMAAYPWFASNDRQLGTLDHPLTMSLLLSLCIPLTANVKRITLQVPAVVFLLIGILLSQSRTGLALAIVGLLGLVLRKRASTGTRVAGISVIGIGFFIFFQSSLAEGVYLRIEDDNGSSHARSLAIRFFFEDLDQYLFGGGGIGSSYATASSGGLATSLESAFLMYAFDLGLILTVVYFGLQAVLAFRRKAGQEALPGTKTAAFFALLIVQTYSSVATDSAAGVLVWVAVGLAVPIASSRFRATRHSVEEALADRKLPSAARRNPSPPARWHPSLSKAES